MIIYPILPTYPRMICKSRLKEVRGAGLSKRGNVEVADPTEEGGSGERTGELALIPHGCPRLLLVV